MEESIKLAVFMIFVWKNKNFNCTFDGLIYSVFVSIGFAMLENILYVFDGGLRTALLRALLSIPGHVAFSVFMGIFYSYAKKAEVDGFKGKSKRLRRTGLLVASLIHGLFDFCLSVNNEIFVIVFVALVVVLDISMFTIVKRESRNDDFIDDSSEQQIENTSDFTDWN